MQEIEDLVQEFERNLFGEPREGGEKRDIQWIPEGVIGDVK